MSKEQPEALQLPTLPFAVFDEFGQPCEDRVRDHFAAAFDALRAQIGQGVPDVKEIRRVLECVKSSVDAGIKVTDGLRILESLLASAPPAPLARAPHSAFAFRECEDSQAGIAPQASAPQQKPLDLSRLQPFVHGLGKAILAELMEEAAHNIGDQR